MSSSPWSENEVDGVCQNVETVVGSRPDWIADKEVNVLFQGGVRPNPQLKGVPYIVDLARTPEEKQAIESSMPAMALAARSSRRPTCRPSVSRCCATPSWPP
jgi:hypothetical protein